MIFPVCVIPNWVKRIVMGAGSVNGLPAMSMAVSVSVVLLPALLGLAAVVMVMNA